MKPKINIQDFIKSSIGTELRGLEGDSSPYIEIPVDIKTFITSPDYLNAEQTTRPVILEDLVTIFQFDETGKMKYHEIVFDEGKGSGKSYKSGVIATYLVYRLLCLKNPQKHFPNLSPGSKIAIMNMSLTGTQARDVVFGQISALVAQCKWFREHGFEPDKDIKSVLRFPKNIYVLPGSSKETAPAGYDIIAGIMDEAAWYTETEGHDVAEEIYYSLQRSSKSRFIDDWLLIMISSPRYTDDFIERKGEESKTNSDIFFRRRPCWRSQMPGYYKSGKVFSYGIYEDIPIELKSDFDKAPTRAYRDYGAIPSLVLEPFFEEYERVEGHVNHSRIDPLPELVKEDGEQIPESPMEQLARLKHFSASPNARYFIHVDLATGGEDGLGCRCGFCMGHIKTVVRKDDGYLPVGCIDLMTRFKASPTKEIQFDEVREFILHFRNAGFHLEKVSYDGWESIDSRQLLMNKGVNTDELSVKISAYETMKEMIYTGRLDYYNHKGFLKECQRLERHKGVEITKPRNSCFTGDTKVALLDGRDISFTEIVREYNQGKELWVYSADIEQKKIVPKRISNPRKTGEHLRIVEVILDNHNSIRCTEDHKFMLRDGRYKEAKHLKCGDALMPLYREVSEKGLKGYELLYDPFLNKRHYTHAYMTGQVQKGYVRHHKDFNRLNNNPTNIECISKSNHKSIHLKVLDDSTLQKLAISKKQWHQKNKGTNKYKEVYAKVSNTLRQRQDNANGLAAAKRWVKENNLWGAYQWLRKQLTRCKHCVSSKRFSHVNLIKASRKYNLTKRGVSRTPVELEHILEGCKNRERKPSYNKGKRIEEFFSPEVVNRIRTQNSIAHKGQIPWCIGLTKETDERIMQLALKGSKTKCKMYSEGKLVAWNDGLTKETDERVRLNVERSAETQRNNKNKKNSLQTLEVEQALNHKVVSVINYGYADVYDMEIEGTHNFALTAGVFVHNSKDISDCVAGVCYHMAESLLPGNKKRPRRFEGRTMAGVGTRRTSLFDIPKERRTIL